MHSLYDMLNLPSWARRALARLVALSVVGMFVVNSLMQLAHVQTTEHVFCPETGEVIHPGHVMGPDREALEAELSAQTLTVDVSAHELPHRSDEQESDPVTCSFLTFLTDSAGVEASRADAFEWGRQRAETLFVLRAWQPTQAIPLSIPRYLVAPKNSPPAPVGLRA